MPSLPNINLPQVKVDPVLVDPRVVHIFSEGISMREGGCHLIETVDNVHGISHGKYNHLSWVSRIHWRPERKMRLINPAYLLDYPFSFEALVLQLDSQGEFHELIGPSRNPSDVLEILPQKSISWPRIAWVGDGVLWCSWQESALVVETILLLLQVFFMSQVWLAGQHLNELFEVGVLISLVYHPALVANILVAWIFLPDTIREFKVLLWDFLTCLFVNSLGDQLLDTEFGPFRVDVEEVESE